MSKWSESGEMWSQVWKIPTKSKFYTWVRRSGSKVIWQKFLTLPRHCSTTFPTFYYIKVIPVSVSLTPLSTDVICKRFLITVFNHELILFSFGKWVVLIDSFSHILCVIISKLERARSRTDVNCKHKIDKLRSNAVSGQAKSI